MNKIQKKAWEEAELKLVLIRANDIITSSVIEGGSDDLIGDDYEGELDVVY